MNSLTTAHATVPATELRAPVSELDRAAVAPNTARAYTRACARWDTYRGAAPESDAALAAYVDHLYSAGRSPATIDQAIAAVQYRARFDGRPGPAGAQTRRKADGARRAGKDRGRGQRDGLTWRDVDRMTARAERSGGAHGLRDAALLAVGSDAALRVSELAALNVADVEATGDGAGAVTIRSSKTDQEGRGTVHSLGPDTMTAITAYCQASGIEAGPLFQRIDKGGTPRGRLSAQSVRAIIRTRAAAVPSLRGRAVSGHSLRIGAAQSLAAAGATVAELMQVGRWDSEAMPAHYSRLQRASRDPVARLRYGR